MPESPPPRSFVKIKVILIIILVLFGFAALFFEFQYHSPDQPVRTIQVGKSYTDVTEPVYISLEYSVYKPDPHNALKSDMDLFNLQVDENFLNFTHVAMQLRAYANYHNLAWEEEISARQAQFLAKVESELFSWIKPSYNSSVLMRKKFKGSGIVICVGNNQMALAYSTLRMIREVHQSTLPFEVFYIGKNDLSHENRFILQSIPGTTVRDITKIFDDKITKIGGWAIKPFALLASSFENAMLIDSDVVFLQSPDTLFASKTFKSSGALFYHDRSMFSQADRVKAFFRELFPTPPSNYSLELRIMKDKSAHEQESGVVLINKKTNMVGLMAASFLNLGRVRDHPNGTYKFVYGDKETFWLGFESVRERYLFSEPTPGSIGVAERVKDGKWEICSRQILHLDENKNPMWINGGISESKVLITLFKYNISSPLAKFSEYIAEPGHWSLLSGNMACLSSYTPPISLTPTLTSVVNKSGEIFMHVLDHKPDI